MNPNNLDGSGILGLIDDDSNTYFHSTWKTSINESHYLEVSLPEGMYNAFSFAMIARSSGMQRQFPAVLEIVPTFSEDN